MFLSRSIRTEDDHGQRDIRIYDPDMHIVEIAESMESVIRRFLSQGMSVDEISKRTMYPVDALKCLAGLE